MKNFLLLAFMLTGFCVPGFSQETKQNFQEQLITTISPECKIAAYMFRDLNNDNLDEFLVIGKQGQVKIWSYNLNEAEFEEVSKNLNLPFPNQSLLSLSSFFVDEQDKYLITLTPDGLMAYPANHNGNIEPDGILINRRIQFQFRMDQPVFSEFLRDINQDGRMDVIVPIVDYCEIWINEGFRDDDSSQNKIPAFSKIGKFPIDMVHSRQTDLHDTEGKLSEMFSIPNLLLKDINGDNYLDLVVSHKPRYDYYLLSKDGIIPEKPDVSLDLNLFQDTTPKPEGLQLGQIISIEEPQLIESDLNNDNIPDYIISHMRKFWIFHGTNLGPQFTNPGSIIKIAEDVTVLLPLPLDEDDYPDLLMIKIQLPTLSTVLGGIFTDWKFLKIESIGYKSIQGESFELSSNWKGDIFLQLPSILSIISNPDILDKFQIERQHGPPVYGDFNGDTLLDVAMSNKKNMNFEIWFTKEKDSDKVITNKDNQKELSSKIRKLLFTETNNVWDIDRIVKSLNSLMNEQVYIVTGGAEPDFLMDKFKDKTGIEVLSVDFNHDKKNELLFIYSEPAAENQMRFELYKLKVQ